MRCTEPEIWATTPEWDAPDELIQKYLDHLSVCRFHAEMERGKEDAVRTSFEAARSLTQNGELTFSDQEEEEVLDALERFHTFNRSGDLVETLLFKTDGKEIGTLNLAKARKLKMDVTREKPLQIFGRVGDAGSELLLATYVPLAQRLPGVYSVALNERQSLRLDVTPRGEKVKVTITCMSPASIRERSWIYEKVWLSVRARGEVIAFVAFVIITVPIFFALYLYRAPEPANDNAKHAASNETGGFENLTPMETPSPSTVSNNKGNRTITGGNGEKGADANDQRNTATSVSPPVDPNTSASNKGGLRTGSDSARKPVLLRDVHTIFVDEQESGFKQLVRSAVVKRLGELGFVTEVSREDSDGRLRLKWEGENNVRFEIISKGHKLLDFVAEFADTTTETANSLALQLQEQIQEKRK